MSIPPFEKPTDELRQVRASIPLGGGDSVTVVLSVQRKWLVQDGPDHLDTVPDWRRQWEWLIQIDKNHYSDRGDGRVGRFCYLREEWRDLPIA